MDITSFIVDGRDKALLYGDYSTYHSLLAKRLLNSRKKIGIATRNRGKYAKKDQVTAENVGENHECVAAPSRASQTRYNLTSIRY
jgi:signal recognition particle subunit SRP68